MTLKPKSQKPEPGTVVLDNPDYLIPISKESPLNSRINAQSHLFSFPYRISRKGKINLQINKRQSQAFPAQVVKKTRRNSTVAKIYIVEALANYDQKYIHRYYIYRCFQYQGIYTFNIEKTDNCDRGRRYSILRCI